MFEGEPFPLKLFTDSSFSFFKTIQTLNLLKNCIPLFSLTLPFSGRSSLLFIDSAIIRDEECRICSFQSIRSTRRVLYVCRIDPRSRTTVRGLTRQINRTVTLVVNLNAPRDLQFDIHNGFTKLVYTPVDVLGSLLPHNLKRE